MFALARQRGFGGGSRGGYGGGAIAAISAGQAAARTLSSAGGHTAAAGMSPEARLANLSGDALRDAWRKIKAGR